MKIFKLIFEILNREEKKNYIILFICIFLSSFLEILGLASILPFLFLVSNQQLLESSEYLNYLYTFSLNLKIISSENNFLLLFGFITLFFFFISVLSRIFTFRLVTQFSLNIENSISIRLVSGYLFKNYEWFLNKNISNIHRNILFLTREVVEKTIYPLVNLYSHLIIITIILIFLSFINIIAVINIFLGLIFFFFIFFYFSIKKIKNKGESSFKSNTNRFKVLANIFLSIKHTKVYHLEKKYLNIFSKNSSNFVSNQIYLQLFSILPRQFLELLGFGFIIIFLLINIYYNESPLKDFIPIITIYTLTGYRLLPSLQQIYYSLSNIFFSYSSFINLAESIKETPQEIPSEKKNISKMPYRKSIILDRVSYKYEKSDIIPFNEISLNIKAFSRIGIIGKSGSGKSTLMDIIAGLINPTKGKVSVDKKSLDKNNIFSWQKNIGFVTQNIQLFNDSLLNNITSFQSNKNINQKFIKKISKICCIHDFIVKELPMGYSTVIGDGGVTLSGGQKQRIAILRALYLEPKLLILDEATNSLDKQTEELIIKSICNFSKKKMSLIIVSHSMNTLKYCDKIYSLENKKLKTIK
jgi:ABC-type multidrug transport system fused ATPase/permease subunit